MIWICVFRLYSGLEQVGGVQENRFLSIRLFRFHKAKKKEEENRSADCLGGVNGGLNCTFSYFVHVWREGKKGADIERRRRDAVR